MKKGIFYFLLWVLPAAVQAQSSGNTPSSKQAIAFSDGMSDITDSLYQLGSSWGDKFSKVRDEKKFSELVPYRIRVEKFIDKKIVDLRSMKDVGNSKDLRLGMIEFLQFEKEMIS